MRPAVVLGNGISRRQLDLEEIPWDTFGCNGIILEFRPTYLLYGDKKGTADVKRSGILHQKPPEYADVYKFKSCGGAAFHAACAMGYSPVYLIGFDGDDTGHACPNFGLRGKWGWPYPPGAWDAIWRKGFEKVMGLYPDVEVFIMGGGPTYLEGLFERAPLKPWNDPC